LLERRDRVPAGRGARHQWSVGVGKSTIAYEVSNQLQAAGIGHALLDSDELDRLFPVPADQVELGEQNLRAVWSSFAKRGATRLVLVGVFIDVEAELDSLRSIDPRGKLDRRSAAGLRSDAGGACCAPRDRLRPAVPRGAIPAASGALRLGPEARWRPRRHDRRTLRVDVAHELLWIVGWLGG
jgi:hypothetical protein